jgi:hypothetical protein
VTAEFTFEGEEYDYANRNNDAVNNFDTVVIDGYGGPRGIFDHQHYLRYARITGALLAFKANFGVVTAGQRQTWFVSLIRYGDDLSTSLIQWPPADQAILDFAQASIQIFLNAYNPTSIHFVASNTDIDPVTYNWGFSYVPP